LALKPVLRRAAADQDIEAIIDRYLTEGGADLALRFVDALETACQHLSRHPGTGSARHAEALDIPGLRSWGLRTFPYLVFYFERSDAVEVWRVLHSRRDIPAHLQDPEEDPPAA
jgi:toxin ParE1/3/4